MRPPAGGIPRGEARLALTAEQLHITRGDRTLVSGLDLRVEPGQCWVLSGPSGSGKTSLLRALAGLDPIAGGSVRWQGRTPAQWGWPTWRAEVSWVSQHPPQGTDTPSERLGRCTALAGQQGREHTDAIALAGEWGLPEAAWRQPWAELSGGEAQRAWLATVLSLSPAVLLLDEPTSGLDPTSTEAVLASLCGHTCLWVTHDTAIGQRVATHRLELS